jgi:Mor family transcriptional regulator
MTDWIDTVAAQVTVEDLPETYRQVAEVIGVESAVKLSRTLGGLNFYFPQIETLLRKKRDQIIRRDFNGRNHRELARRYNLSEVWVREIVDARTIDNQPSLFEPPTHATSAVK